MIEIYYNLHKNAKIEEAIMSKAVSFSLLFFVFIVAVIASPITVPLDAYKTAVNAGNPDLIEPFLADSFEYLDMEVPLSITVLRRMIYLAPYTINSFENVNTTAQEGALLVECDAAISISGLNDTIPMAFLLREDSGSWKLLAVVEPSAERLAATDDVIGAISTPMTIDKGRIFVLVEFADGKTGEMVVHNALQKSIITPKFADKLGAKNGIVPQIMLCGITKENFPVDVGEIDVSKAGKNDVVGALGGDFFGKLTILIDNKNERISLIDRNERGEYTVPLKRFGIDSAPKFKTQFLGDYQFDMVSVDLGFGFEAPMVLDISSPKITLFADFFEKTPGLKMDEKMRTFIIEHPGRVYTHKYVSFGKMRKERVNSKISDSRMLCGYEFPKGIAGIIGISFLNSKKIVIDDVEKTLSVY